jgi:hypothetical protein
MTVWPGSGGFGGSMSVGEGAEHGGGALSAAGDGALGGAIAEIDDASVAERGVRP